ncbi:hypothetical protein ABE10_00685, partial [Bacillus toyonensis]|nr:hypothetical protein [Bacillus toyonensis]
PAYDHDRARMERPGGRLGADQLRRHEGAVHSLLHERGPALADRQGQGLGHGGVRDAAPGDQRAQRQG